MLTFFRAKYPNLFRSACVKMIKHTLKHGISKYSCHRVCAFAVVLSLIYNESSYDFGKLSLQLLKKSRAKDLSPILNTIFFALISPLYASVCTSLVPLTQVASMSLKFGSQHFIKSAISFAFSAFEWSLPMRRDAECLL